MATAKLEQQRRTRDDGRASAKRRTGSPMADDTGELVERFTLQQRRRGLMTSTIETRCRKLLLLAEYLHPRGLLEAEREDVERFLDDRQLGARARYAYISHLHVFYEAMIEDGRTTAAPTASIRRPRQRAGLPRPIGDGDLADAIRQAEPIVGAALTLAAYQGLRAAEIAHLQREDILDSNAPPVLHVVEGKGGKDRVLPLHPEVMPVLRRAGMPSSGPVLRRPRGGAFTPAAVSKKMNAYLHDIGIDATLHQLRHWFGTKTYQSTRDLRLVQGLLGHSSPTSTAVYAQYAIEGAEGAVLGLDARGRHDARAPSEDAAEGRGTGQSATGRVQRSLVFADGVPSAAPAPGRDPSDVSESDAAWPGGHGAPTRLDGRRCW